MADFWIFFEIGLRHVLNISSYDHILFIAVLVIPYVFKDWKKLLLLISFFTIGHTLALILSVFKIIIVREQVVESAIPITILFTALYDLFTSGKSFKSNSIAAISVLTLFFGVVHGLAFSNYFKSILFGAPQSKILPMLSFALGIEVSQLIIMAIVLLISVLVQSVFRFSKREVTLVTTAFVIGVIMPLIFNNPIWKLF